MLDSWSKGWRPRTKPYLYTSVYIKALAIQRKKNTTAHRITFIKHDLDRLNLLLFVSTNNTRFVNASVFSACSCVVIRVTIFFFIILHLPFIIYEVLLESICPSRLKCLPSRWLLCNTHSIRVETTTASLPQHRLRFSGFALMKALRAFC